MDSMPTQETTEREEKICADSEQENATDTSQCEDELCELKAALMEAKIRAQLLMAGAAKEKLNEAERLVRGLCSADADIETAVGEIMENYPHLKTRGSEIPQLCAQSGGSTDGFALIRSIFAKR